MKCKRFVLDSLQFSTDVQECDMMILDSIIETSLITHVCNISTNNIMSKNIISDATAYLFLDRMKLLMSQTEFVLIILPILFKTFQE